MVLINFNTIFRWLTLGLVLGCLGSVLGVWELALGARGLALDVQGFVGICRAKL